MPQFWKIARLFDIKEIPEQQVWDSSISRSILQN